MRALSTIGIKKCRWWHRAWTVQEAILPSDLIFVWGPLSLSLDTIRPAISNKSPIKALAFMTQEEYTTAIRIGGMRHLLTQLDCVTKAKKGIVPIRTSILWRDRAATDPRDNVFALTGLHAADALPRSNKCDYSLDMNEVFVNYTIHWISSTAANTLNPVIWALSYLILGRRKPRIPQDYLVGPWTCVQCQSTTATHGIHIPTTAFTKPIQGSLLPTDQSILVKAYEFLASSST